ncbi:isocitrate lyase/phosphoenolpyruvate mutase family protein [Actinotalea ferrariae]|uniref:isocitrate lyase/PEP mutase family protein n=1 Tax=Actinotalea ferrariae TaxID=1386098 RepID=UPI001C8CD04B|nr:isocitrate lyase/phosphoenolpyruvate mutase family protein [Actinotalea ferrariae]MBX9245130.1 isocitrate lyase/phosphoenolpyruvate mutase family protein [Actinotalea ferrariae]
MAADRAPRPTSTATTTSSRTRIGGPPRASAVRSAVAAAFAALHRPGDPLLLPNAWDVASGLVLADAGFAAVGTTSLGVTAAAGLPDGRRAGRDLVVALAGALVDRLRVPVTVDLEDGYADDPAEVAELAAHLAGLGVAGVNLEDGRSGDGEAALRDEAAHAGVIRAVVAAAPSLFVNARTDVHWLGIGDPATRRDATVRRLLAYRDAGAHGVFVPGLADPHDVAVVAASVDLPLNVLWQPGVDLADLAQAGVARVSTGSALYRHALGAAVETACAARTSAMPPVPALGYDRLQGLLTR